MKTKGSGALRVSQIISRKSRAISKNGTGRTKGKLSMTEEQLVLFRAEMFERAAKVLRGEPVDPPANAGGVAASPAAPPAPEAPKTAIEEGRADE